ncbi:MAG: hypothetical protein Q7S52_04455 [bacterium]|nr:hypothetical protein [bacterium]
MEKPHRAFIFDASSEHREQGCMIDRIKKFLYVAFQCKARLCLVLTHATQHFGHFLHPFVRPLANTARKRSCYKGGLKYRIEDAKKSMVQDAIAYGGLVNPSQFGVMDPKPPIWAMAIRATLQISIKIENILLEIDLKLRDIGLIALVGFKNIPCAKKVLYRNY